jgi:hypothetical protein
MREIVIKPSFTHLNDIAMNADMEIEFIEEGRVKERRMYLSTVHATLIGLRIGTWIRGENFDAE